MDIILTIIVVIGNILFAYLALKKDHKSATNISFAILNIIMALLTIINIIPLHTTTEKWTLFWIRSAIVCVIVYLVMLLEFIYTFPSKKLTLPSKKIQMLFGVLGIIGISIAVSPLTFKTVELGGTTPIPHIGFGMYIYTVLSFGLGLISIVLPIQRYRNARGLLKNQWLYLFCGTTLATVLMATFDCIMVVFFKTSGFIVYSPVFMMIFIVFSAYAILRYRLLSLEIIIRQGLVLMVSGIIGIGILIYLILTGAKYWDIPRDIHVGMQMVFVGILAIVFYGLKKIVEKIIARIWPHQDINISEIFSQSKRQEGKLEQQLPKSVKGMVDILKVQKVHILIKDKVNKTTISYTYPKTMVSKEQFEDAWCDTGEHFDVIITDELPHFRKIEAYKKLKKWDITAVLRLWKMGIYEARVLIGPKISENGWNNEEITTLNAIQKQAEEAIGWMMLYDNSVRAIKMKKEDK